MKRLGVAGYSVQIGILEPTIFSYQHWKHSSLLTFGINLRSSSRTISGLVWNQSLLIESSKHTGLDCSQALNESITSRGHLVGSEAGQNEAIAIHIHIFRTIGTYR